MEVLNYKKCANNLYEVKLDNGEKYKLYEDVIINYELLIDKRITDIKLKKILRDNDLYASYYKALKYIGIKMRTQKEIELYLKKNNFDKDAIDYSVSKLKNNGYINENIYTEAYINDAINLSYDGPKKIINNLTKVGISEEVIFNHLNYDKYFWQNRIKEILNKKAKMNKNSLALFKNKMYSHLTLLGYEIDDIKCVLEDYKLDTSSLFKKDADKIWNTLRKKMSQEKIVWQFKNKMYLKGYTHDEINEYIEQKKDY